MSQALGGIVVEWSGCLVRFIIEFQADYCWQKWSVLWTEEAFNIFFSAKRIHQNNGERQGYKKTTRPHCGVARLFEKFAQKFPGWSFCSSATLTQLRLQRYLSDLLYRHEINYALFWIDLSRFDLIRQWVSADTWHDVVITTLSKGL